MIKGLTRAGIGQVGSIEQFVHKASQHGFGAIDASGSELRNWTEGAGLEAAKSTLKQNNIIIGSIELPVEWRVDETRFRDGLPQLAQDAEIAATFGVTACCTYVLPSTDLKAAHFMALATRRLRTCADILGEYGIRFGLEFIGPHHLRTQWANPFVWTIEETIDWIDAIGLSNVGLLFDAYHWYTTEAGKADILRLKPEQIVHVHLNDAKHVPIRDLLDYDRVYPGEGVIDLKTFLESLNTIGYKGVIAQEILTQQPPTDTTDELIARSAAGYRKVYAQAGLS